MVKLLDWFLSLGSKKERVRDLGDGWYIQRVQLDRDCSPFYELCEGRKAVAWGLEEERLVVRYEEIIENRKIWDSSDY